MILYSSIIDLFSTIYIGSTIFNLCSDSIDCMSYEVVMLTF